MPEAKPFVPLEFPPRTQGANGRYAWVNATQHTLGTRGLLPYQNYVIESKGAIPSG